ncbi:MAG TPA: hypothetical protein PK867_22760, partial [Pirellulales bacterium]|nr:hypothetical protein [Pirellulales bacterium]
AAKDAENAATALGRKQEFFDLFGDGPEAQAKWDRVSSLANASIDFADGAEQRENNRRADEEAARQAQQDYVKMLPTDPPIIKGEAQNAHELGLLAEAAYPGVATPAGWQKVEE